MRGSVEWERRSMQAAVGNASSVDPRPIGFASQPTPPRLRVACMGHATSEFRVCIQLAHLGAAQPRTCFPDCPTFRRRPFAANREALRAGSCEHVGLATMCCCVSLQCDLSSAGAAPCAAQPCMLRVQPMPCEAHRGADQSPEAFGGSHGGCTPSHAAAQGTHRSQALARRLKHPCLTTQSPPLPCRAPARARAQTTAASNS